MITDDSILETTMNMRNHTVKAELELPKWRYGCREPKQWLCSRSTNWTYIRGNYTRKKTSVNSLPVYVTPVSLIKAFVPAVTVIIPFRRTNNV